MIICVTSAKICIQENVFKTFMKKWIFLFIILLGIFEVAILDYFEIFDVKPNLLLIVVVISGLSLNLKQVLFFSIFAGIFKDVFGINLFGINTLLFSLWGFLTVKLSQGISIENSFIFALFIFIIASFDNVINKLISIFLNEPVSPIGISLRIILLGSLYTAIIAFFLFRVTKHLASVR